MKLGYSTWGMATVPVDVSIPHVSELGFDGLELAVTPRFTTELSTLDSAARKRIAGLLKDHKLNAVGNRRTCQFDGTQLRCTRPKYVTTHGCRRSSSRPRTE